VAWVPLLESDVHDLTALDRIRDLLFRPGVVGERPPTD
jgi:hypothetical protein